MLRPMALVLVLVVVLAAPLAQAGITLRASFPQGPPTGGAAVKPMSLDITVPCQQALPASGADPQYSLHFEAAAPAPVVVTGPIDFGVDSSPCLTPGLNQSIESVQTYTVSINRDAPGLQPLPVRLAVSLNRSVAATAPVSPSPNGTLDLTVTADYAGLLEVVMPMRVVSVHRGASVEIPLLVHNLGNARTTVTLEQIGATAPANGTLLLPAAATLDGAYTPGGTTNRTVTLRFTAPDAPWPTQTVRVRLTPASADQPGKAGAPVDLSFVASDADDKPVINSVDLPSPGAVEAFVLLAMALLARRRA